VYRAVILNSAFLFLSASSGNLTRVDGPVTLAKGGTAPMAESGAQEARATQEGSIDLPASLSVFGAEPSPILVTVTRPSPGKRLARAARGAGIFWAVAAGCVFLPGLHFVLVPTFLLAGVVAGMRHLRDTEVTSRVHGACPRCGHEQDFAAGNRLTPTWSLDCPTCHNTLTLTLSPKKAAA